MKKIIIALTVMTHFSALAELKPLAETELQKHTGQTGITLSAKFEFGQDTRISYNNPDGSFVNPQKTWLVVNQVTGSVEMKGLDIDLESGLGPQADKSAVVVTLPEEVIVNHLATEGVYVGLSEDVDTSSTNAGNHVFLMGLDIDGVLSMPAQTKINIFPAEKSAF